MKKAIDLTIAEQADALALQAALSATEAGRAILSTEYECPTDIGLVGDGLHQRYDARGPHHCSFSFQPEHIDINSKRGYTQGWCWLLALEIAEATGWPIILVTRSRTAKTAADVKETWSHALVRTPSGHLLDINGIRTEDEVCRANGEFGIPGLTARCSKPFMAREGRHFRQCSRKVAAYNAHLTRRVIRELTERLVAEADCSVYAQAS